MQAILYSKHSLTHCPVCHTHAHQWPPSMHTVLSLHSTNCSNYVKVISKYKVHVLDCTVFFKDNSFTPGCTMSVYQEDYGQYSASSQQQGVYSGLNIEDQSETMPPHSQAAAAWGSGSGYNNPPASGAEQQVWGGDSNPRARYSAPPVQPMYNNDPRYQQGIV